MRFQQKNHLQVEIWLKAKDKKIEEAKNLNWKIAAEELGGLPPAKVHCAAFAVDALKTAIENYEFKKGPIKEKKPTTIEIIKNRLKHVINPITGVDVSKVNFIKSIELENGVVKVFFNLDSNHQFANNIREEIIERLEPLWDIKEVKVIFNDEEG